MLEKFQLNQSSGFQNRAATFFKKVVLRKMHVKLPTISNCDTHMTLRFPMLTVAVKEFIVQYITIHFDALNMHEKTRLE